MSTQIAIADVVRGAAKPLFGAALLGGYRYITGTNLWDSFVCKETGLMAASVFGGHMLFDQLVPYVSSATGADLDASRSIGDPLSVGALYAAGMYFLGDGKSRTDIFKAVVAGSTVSLSAEALASPLATALAGIPTATMLN